MIDKLRNLKSKLGRWFWVVLAAIAVIVWRIIVSSGGAVKVESAKVSRGNLVEAISTSGTVKADEYSNLTFQSGGLVSWVGVKSGDKVVKGQAIAQLDTVSLNAAYQDAINTYRKYQATAENILDQVKNHSSDETFSQKDTRTTAEVNRDNAYNDMISARKALNNAIIYAPFDGVVDTVSPSSPGVNVILGSASYILVNPDSVYFDAEVEETDLPNIKTGQDVNIKLDAYPDESFRGTVTNIGVVAFTSSTGGNSYHVRISMPGNTDLKFKVGMGGDVDIVYNTISDTLKVPSSAVVLDTNNFVWLIDGGRAKKIQVEVGGASLDETEIKSGLTEGETIISQPPSNLKEGQKVGI